MKNNKEKLLNKAKSHIDFVIEKVKEKFATVKKIADQGFKELSKMSPADQAVFMKLKANADKRVLELRHLESSPYFMKCAIVDEFGNEKDYFFAKHEFSEQSIYSWVAPVSAIRFDNPGKVSYQIPNGRKRTITLKQKEIFTIVNGKIMLYAIEREGQEKELIYQENFTKQKSEFVLPEIVAQMEKLQDQVIRASHKGSLVISGPAGSGKTTLALHRVAYLTQIPDLSEIYSSNSIFVLVQDNGTKNYFATLLPSLGINDVKITTFSEWAFKILGIKDFIVTEQYGDDLEQKDLYEYEKINALRNSTPKFLNDFYATLDSCYRKSFSNKNLEIFEKQKSEKKLDRIDLTILLRSYYSKYKKFEMVREYQMFVKQKLVKKTERTLISYSLMVVDEFQNYLPEQLEIFKKCINPDTNSMIYVGDMAQQVRLGTIRKWEEIEDKIPSDRYIKLNKVYRNTKQIIQFIKNLGYEIESPDGLKDGPAVVEKIVNSRKEEIDHIKKIIPRYKNGNIGILAKEESYLVDFKKEFSDQKHIHVLSMIETQGVEFDLVFLVGMKKGYFDIGKFQETSTLYVEEKKKIDRDLLYVALTRAMTELHVLSLEELCLA